MNKGVQAKDIADRAFLEAVETAQRARLGKGETLVYGTGGYDGFPWTNTGEVHASLTVITGREWPWKVELAKYRQLEKRKLLDGCGCGCRGDWHLTVKGKTRLDELTLGQDIIE